MLMAQTRQPRRQIIHRPPLRRKSIFERQNPRLDQIRLRRPQPRVRPALCRVRPAMKPRFVVINLQKQRLQPRQMKRHRRRQLVPPGITAYMRKPDIHRCRYILIPVIPEHDRVPGRLLAQYIRERRPIIVQLLGNPPWIVQPVFRHRQKFIQHRVPETMQRHAEPGLTAKFIKQGFRRHQQPHRVIDVKRGVIFRQIK